MIPNFDEKRTTLFWSRVDKRPGHGPFGDCWLWLGGLTAGYGTFGFQLDGRVMTYLAHRVSYFLSHGLQPEEVCCHRCDNPPCVNPTHLFSGTQADNVFDREAKGRGGGEKRRGKNNGRHTMPERTCRGEAWHEARPPAVLRKMAVAIRKFHQEHPDALKGTNNPRAKLTEEDVREIRRAYAAKEASSLKLATRFGVSKPVVLSIIHRRSWMHVT